MESSHHRKRRRAFNDSGHAHFLTFSCWKRWPLLARDRSRQWLVDTLDQARESLDFAVWADVIMPEHVHLLILPRQSRYEMRRILAVIKAPVSRQAKKFLVASGAADWLQRLTTRHGPRETFRFWQPGGGYDGNLWQSLTIAAAIDYIHANPVRRGPVLRPTDWRWSSAAAHAGRDDVPLRIDQVDLA